MTRIAVIGAGTMGSGIAQIGVAGGFEVTLFDPDPEALTHAEGRIHTGLQKNVDRGRMTVQAASEASARLKTVDDIAGLVAHELVIEAVTEDLDIKLDVLRKVAAVCGKETVLATNTSSIPVTAIAAGVQHPERVVGMHFFNPPPAMKLVEVIAGTESSEAALTLARAVGRQMGKEPIDAADGPGFLVNRCGRPFGLEGLRLLQERIADHETIDRICRMGGGFRMGPFELMDLIGIDVGLEVAESFYRLSFGEPRWRPNPIQARMAAAGRHGRKTGRGYYSYDDGPHRPDDPDPHSGSGGAGTVTITGATNLAHELALTVRAAGYKVEQLANAAMPESGEFGEIVIHAETSSSWGNADGEDARDARPNAFSAVSGTAGPLHLWLCASGSLAQLARTDDAVGFNALPPLAQSHIVELTRTTHTSDESAHAAERFFESVGKHTVWVGDAPGLVLGRVVCQLINESMFALQEEVGSTADIDKGVTLGLNYPRGTLAWADLIGLDHVLAVLDALHREFGDDRYRAAPLIRQHVATGFTTVRTR